MIVADLLAVYNNVVEMAAHGDEPVTLSFPAWIAARNVPGFAQLDRPVMLAYFGRASQVDDFNALETELEETNAGNGAFELRRI